MSFHATDDADPDPTTQMPWPAARNRQRTASGSQHIAVAAAVDLQEDGSPNKNYQSTRTNGKKTSPSPASSTTRLTTWNLITLSISMAGAQIAWTVELGYGTPFLLSLGISEQLTSLVWLAGPISGLIAQPVIGAISDSSTSKYRRRYWIVLSTAVLVFSTLILAYCQSIAGLFVDMVGGGAGDWDPKRTKQVANTAIGLAIFSFYLLDFALNALQASLRNLLLDIAPPDQLNAGNAWHGRMTHAGNIIGFGFGFLPLASLPILRLLGGDQFRKFCVVSMVILVITVWITCFYHEEKEGQEVRKPQSRFRDVLEGIYTAMTNLPKPIRRVCLVQVFAFMGWFPFLFYATTYVGQVMAYESGTEPDDEIATRKGEFAMLLYSIVAVAAGSLLPHLTRRDRRLLPQEGDNDEEVEFSHLRDMISDWKAEAARDGKPFRLPRMPFLLRNIWTGALLLFTVLTFSTFWVSTVAQATVVISLVGICWAVACWVPFAIIMELLKELDYSASERNGSAGVSRLTAHARATSESALIGRSREQEPLVRHHSYDEYDAPVEDHTPAAPVAGGTVLGIHNLAIVLPQFIVALVSSAIFRAVDADISDDPLDHNTYLGKNGVAWVLRFGGLCTLAGALISRKVPPTRAEKAMRRRLAELKEVSLAIEETTP